MCAHFVETDMFSGRFSPDERSFEATERWTFRLDGKQRKTITFSWSGVRQP
jgi:hypothetical protein